jgi:hypothetical protein
VHLLDVVALASPLHLPASVSICQTLITVQFSTLMNSWAVMTMNVVATVDSAPMMMTWAWKMDGNLAIELLASRIGLFEMMALWLKSSRSFL